MPGIGKGLELEALPEPVWQRRAGSTQQPNAPPHRVREQQATHPRQQDQGNSPAGRG
jgi:hypothetical protein